MARAQPSATTPAPASGAEEFLPLTREQISSQTDPNSFSRGQSYFRSGHIFAPTRRGPLIQARCHGSSGGPYRVEATLATAGGKRRKNPIDYVCDCPRGGFCKHVVALLLTWIDAPDRFTLLPPVAETLAGKSKDELVALVERMVREQPELEALLDLPVPVGGALGDEPIDEAALRRQIEAAFAEQQTGRHKGSRRYGWYDYDDWESASRIAGNLQRLVDVAQDYAESGDWRNAVAVLAVVAEMTIPHLSRFADPNGDLYTIVGECDAGLAEGLAAQDGAPPADRLTSAGRRRALDTLVAIWEADIEHDGPGIAEDGWEAIAKAATSEEKSRIAEKLREMARRYAGDDESNAWTRKAILGFLADLGRDGGLSDEELLAEYRAAGFWEEAAFQLLQMGRLDEAVGAAARHVTRADTLIAFASELMDGEEPGRIDLALDLVDGRLWEQEGKNPRDDLMLLGWLAHQYTKHGQAAKAFDLSRRRFDVAPSKEGYDALKAAARMPGQPDGLWERTRPAALKALRKQGGAGALIEIYLEEGDVAAAVKALEAGQKQKGGLGYGFATWWSPLGSLEARVAAAAETTDPDASIRIYRRMADRQIEARDRNHYRQAADHLAQIKRIMTTAGRSEQWSAHIAELRQQHKSLRALREELDALDLR